VNPVQRLAARQLFALDRNCRLVAPERCEVTGRAGVAGDRSERAVQLWRAVQRVDGVGIVVDPGVGCGDVVDDELDARGDLALGDIGRDNGDTSLCKSPCNVGTTAHADLDDPVEDGQSINECCTGVVHGGMFMSHHTICVCMDVDVVPVGDVSARVKREASDGLRTVYDCEVSMHEPEPIPTGAYDADRDQYRAEEFIDLAQRVGSGRKNIAITPEDLYYRRRNYVFGLAYLSGSGSVISTHRLQTSSDGGFSNRSASDIFADRVRKEVVHEIGHTLGLEHCDNKRCVMNFSPTVREVDVKEQSLCGTCQRDVA